METIQQLRWLSRPTSIRVTVQKAKDACLRLAENATKGNCDIVEIMDDLSNKLCLMLDPLECLRLTSVHPYLKDEAQAVVETMIPIMHSLNTDQQLFKSLRAYCREHSQSFSPEKQAVSISMMRDYRMYGLDRPNFTEIARLHQKHRYLSDLVAQDFTREQNTSEQNYHRLFQNRSELASALGHSSYLNLVNQGNILKSKSAVMDFLSSKKDQQAHSNVFNIPLPEAESNPEWNTLDNVIRRLCVFTSHIFALKIFINRKPGGMFILTLADALSSQHLGKIIVDPLYRKGKTIGPSHFTLISSYKRTSVEQYPVMFVSCNIKNSRDLALTCIATLFHEFGHALHGALATTRYQTLSGTRVSMDFAEYPSTLLEKCAYSWEVLKFMGAPESVKKSLEEHLNSSTPLELRREQIKIAHADILAHSRSSLYDNVCGEAELLSGSKVSERRWLGHIEHLNLYGASYYSYLLADSLASLTFEQLSIQPDIGYKLRKKILSQGGTVSPLDGLRSCGIAVLKL